MNICGTIWLKLMNDEVICGVVSKRGDVGDIGGGLSFASDPNVAGSDSVTGVLGGIPFADAIWLTRVVGSL